MAVENLRTGGHSMNAVNGDSNVSSDAMSQHAVHIAGQSGGRLDGRRRAIANDTLRREAEERFQTLAETASDVILTVDELGDIVFANSAITQVFGYKPEEVIGQNMGMLMPEASRSWHLSNLVRYIKTGQRLLSWSSIEWIGLHRDGREISLELSLGEFASNGRRYFTGIARDVTDRKRSELLIAGQVKIFEMIATGRELSAVLERIAQLIEDVAGNLHCVVFQFDPEGDVLVAKSAPSLPKDFLDSLQALPIGMRSGTCGASIAQREPQISQDVTNDSRWADYLDFVLSYGVRSSWSTPILDAGRNPLGTISILYDHLHNPKPYELEFVNVATHLASIALERVRAEQKLQANEARFRALIEKSGEGVSLTRLDGTVLYTSPSIKNLFGYDSEEIVGIPASERIHPEDLPRVRAVAYSLAERHGASDNVLYRVKHKNGSWRWGEATMTNMLDEPSVQALVINFRDITERKLAEDALRISEERYRTVVAALDEGIILMDENAVLLTSNASAERILGLTEEQIRNRTLFDPDWITIHEDGSQFVASDFPAAVTFRTGESCSNVVMGVKKTDGQIVWISINTRPLFRMEEQKPYAVVISFADITEQLRAQTELRDSEERFSTAFKSSPCPMALLAFPEGWFVNVNVAWEKIFGYSLEEVAGQSSEEITLWQDIRQREEMYRRLMEDGVVRNLEVVALSKNGKEVIYVMSAEIIEFGGKKYVLSSCYDITERKLAEQKLEQLYVQSRALSARLETVREEERAHMAREIHDNLGQMMTGLKLDFSWLEKRMVRVKEESLRKEMEPKLIEIADLLEETIQTVRNIATDLRPGVLDTLGLRAAIDWQVREFERRNSINCSSKLCQDPPNLSPERATALFRILQEVLTNITRHAKAKKVRVEMAKADGAILLTIADDGIGITEEQIQNPKSLGLLGVRERAVILGGSVVVTGEQGGGTTVKVRMPIKNKTGQLS